MKQSQQNLRRRFIRKSACSLLGSAPIVNTLANLQLASAAATVQGGNTDYKALVCVFLFGGNDSFNMLIPATPEAYGLYKNSRNDLALTLPNQQDSKTQAALELPTQDTAARKFAVHPKLSELHELYSNGRLCFLANTGTLIEPTSVSAYKKRSIKIPKALFSHNDQRDHWQTGLPQTTSATGWLGRAIDLMMEAGDTSKALNSISLSGNNLLQTGQNATPYTITPEGSISMKSPLASALFEAFGPSSAGGTQDTPHQSILESVYKQSGIKSIAQNRRFSSAYDGAKLPLTSPAHSTLAHSFDAIAKAIAVKDALGVRRQTFFIMVNGWDNHQNLLEDHQTLLADLSRSMSRFQLTLDRMGAAEQVTTFTASDFGRTLRSNGRGSDHGWGGNHIIMGGQVKGGRIYGEYPEALILNDGLDVGKNGRLLPTTSCDQYFEELLRWFGVDNSVMPDILPNVSNFPTDTLGFLAN